MRTVTFSLEPESAFGTRFLGDTLFGQLCWTLRNLYSEAFLTECLQGYTAGEPFAVVSDAFPAGYVARPDLPMTFLRSLHSGEDRKEAKKQIWLLTRELAKSSSEWSLVKHPIPAKDAGLNMAGCTRGSKPPAFLTEAWQSHNQIDRRLATTNAEGLAPFTAKQWWYAEGTTLQVHVCHDPARIESKQLGQALATIGSRGFGADASTGLGRFRVEEVACPLPEAPDHANAWLTLAPCAPQGLDLNRVRSWYRPFTRFGRHGDMGALSSNPFKSPLLLTCGGAVFSPTGHFAQRRILGQGLGGLHNPISKSLPATVHQGYAPVVGIHVMENGEELS